MSPDMSYSKGGAELADALEQVANDSDLIANPGSAFEVLGISLPPETIATASLDPEELLRAAEAIRSGAIPAFWPYIWYIPWITMVAPPEAGGSV